MTIRHIIEMKFQFKRNMLIDQTHLLKRISTARNTSEKFEIHGLLRENYHDRN